MGTMYVDKDKWEIIQPSVWLGITPTAAVPLLNVLLQVAAVGGA